MLLLLLLLLEASETAVAIETVRDTHRNTYRDTFINAIGHRDTPYFKKS